MLVYPVRVFIVDDSPQLTDMFSELFGDPETIDIVGICDSALNACEEIRLTKPDVVIVDLQLKDGSGFDVVKGIRLLPEATGIVVILFTNHASRELHQHAVALGANYFLDKSRDLEKVVEILQEKVRARTA